MIYDWSFFIKFEIYQLFGDISNGVIEECALLRSENERQSIIRLSFIFCIFFKIIALYQARHEM